MSQANVVLSSIAALALSSIIFGHPQSAGGARPRPAGHGYHAMVYDSAAQRIILYGGQTGDIFSHPETYMSSETWAYDPAENHWELLCPSGQPPALAAHAMAYDERSGKTVLHGGVLVTKDKEARVMDQTWLFDYGNKAWKRASAGPSERYGQRMAGIAKCGIVVLFGGARVDAATKTNAFKLDDTWTYEASTDRWKEMRPSPSPSPRHYFGMVYDSKADRVIVWGGAREGSPDASSVWIYDPTSNTWTERKPAAGPAPRSYVAMAYDVQADKTIMFGGNSEGMDDTWIYDYETNMWIQRRPGNNPGKRSRMPIVYVPGMDRTVLFGGQMDKRQFVYSDQTWFYGYNSNTWENVIVRPGKTS